MSITTFSSRQFNQDASKAKKTKKAAMAGPVSVRWPAPRSDACASFTASFLKRGLKTL